MFPNIFEESVSEEVIKRLDLLAPDSVRLWGTMNPAQMFAHCSVAYETIYEPEKHAPPNFAFKFVARMLFKSRVTGEKPLARNSPTAPMFKVSPNKDFEIEKARLIEFIRQTQKLGEEYFDGKENMSFGVLTSADWSNMMYKHLDHHLNQFGA
ncbi:MAG: DUF1569 domain-containing protein [Pyrinomonadaceae bacterium]